MRLTESKLKQMIHLEMNKILKESRYDREDYGPIAEIIEFIKSGAVSLEDALMTAEDVIMNEEGIGHEMYYELQDVTSIIAFEDWLMTVSPEIVYAITMELGI